MTPTRSGVPCASRSLSFAYRFIARLGREQRLQRRLGRSVLPRQRHLVLLQQAVVGEAPDRCEIPVRYVFGPLEASDVVGDGAQAQVDAYAVPRGEVRCRGV